MYDIFYYTDNEPVVHLNIPNTFTKSDIGLITNNSSDIKL